MQATTTAAIVLTVLSYGSLAHALRQSESLSGTVKEIHQDGRKRTLVVTLADGTEQSFPLTPRIQVETSYQADASHVSPGVFISAEGTLNPQQQQLILNNITVYPVGPGQQVPAAGIKPVRPAPQPGVPQQPPMGPITQFEVAGQVLARRPSPMFQQYEQLALQLPGRVPPIMMESTATVKLITSGTEDIPADAPISLEVIKRGTQMSLMKATIDGGQAPAVPAAQDDGQPGASPEGGPKPGTPEM